MQELGMASAQSLCWSHSISAKGGLLDHACQWH